MSLTFNMGLAAAAVLLLLLARPGRRLPTALRSAAVALAAALATTLGVVFKFCATCSVTAARNGKVVLTTVSCSSTRPLDAVTGADEGDATEPGSMDVSWAHNVRKFCPEPQLAATGCAGLATGRPRLVCTSVTRACTFLPVPRLAMTVSAAGPATTGVDCRKPDTTSLAACCIWLVSACTFLPVPMSLTFNTGLAPVTGVTVVLLALVPTLAAMLEFSAGSRPVTLLRMRMDALFIESMAALIALVTALGVAFTFCATRLETEVRKGRVTALLLVDPACSSSERPLVLVAAGEGAGAGVSAALQSDSVFHVA
ncbi:hypothetical protein V8C86DRAFT_2507189 [Haematococcus lacustris]